MIAAWARRLGTARRLSGVARAPPGATLVFDLDGTLVETAPDLCAAVNVLLGELGRDTITLEETKNMIGDGMVKLADRALRATGGACAGEELASNAARLHDIYVDACCVDTYLYEGVPETLATLRGAGYKLAVCTNKPFAPAEIILEETGVAQYFEGALVGGDTLGEVRKPNAEHLLHAVALAGGDNGSVVMIGDGHNDILVAKAAGVPSIGLMYGYTRIPLAELGAEALLGRFDEIPAAVESLLHARDLHGDPNL